MLNPRPHITLFAAQPTGEKAIRSDVPCTVPLLVVHLDCELISHPRLYLKVSRCEGIGNLDARAQEKRKIFRQIRSLVIPRLPQSTKILQSRPPVTPPWRPKRKQSLGLLPRTIALSQSNQHWALPQVGTLRSTQIALAEPLAFHLISPKAWRR
jgi:hypothetical protein